MTATFGKRGLQGPPVKGPPPGKPPAPPRRMRSNAVAVGAVGLLALGLTASAGYREYRCAPPEKHKPVEGETGQDRKPPDKDERPDWCRSSGSGHYSGGHGWGFSSGGSGGGSSSHASFGGFGAHGSGHGSGS